MTFSQMTPLNHSWDISTDLGFKTKSVASKLRWIICLFPERPRFENDFKTLQFNWFVIPCRTIRNSAAAAADGWNFKQKNWDLLEQAYRAYTYIFDWIIMELNVNICWTLHINYSVSLKSLMNSELFFALRDYFINTLLLIQLNFFYNHSRFQFQITSLQFLFAFCFGLWVIEWNWNSLFVHIINERYSIIKIIL